MFKRPSWLTYTKKLREKILNPRHAGSFSESLENQRLVIGEEGCIEEGFAFKLFLLVSEIDGQILKARYKIFGNSALVGAAEILSELLLHKNYDQARRISVDLIDTSVREKTDESAFPAECYSELNLLLSALDKAISNCEGIPLPSGYVATPVDLSAFEVGEYPDWESLSHQSRLALVNDVLLHTVMPYIALDEGGVEVVELIDTHLHIKYSGSCTTCHSSTTSTLNAIQQILRAKVQPSITLSVIL